MKKYILSLSSLSIACILVFALAACSQDNDLFDAPEVTEPVAEEYVYTVHLDCDAPLFDDEAGTRANYSWPNGSKLYLRFSNGSSYVTGTAVYSSSTGKWTISSNTALTTSNTSKTCYANYFINSGTSTSTYVNLTAKTACYYGAGTYTHPTSTDIYLKVKLSPKTWRLRFSGSSSTSITVTNSSDINYNTKFDIANGTYTAEKQNVSLSVGSNGYTDYVYGQFVYSSSNKIYVKNGSDTYYRSVSGSNLKEKESAYMVIPTASNYSSNGWTKESKYVSYCDLKTSYPFAFTDCIITGWTIGSNVSRAYIRVYKSSEISSLSDESIISKLVNETTYRTASELKDYSWRYGSLSTSTNYVLCTYCYDSNGNHGNLVKYSFKTSSTYDPKAEINEVTYNNYYQRWYCTFKKRNSAYSYYAFAYQGTDNYNQDIDFLAYSARKSIALGTATCFYDWTSSVYVSKTSIYIVWISWAKDSSGNMGIYDYWRGYASSAPEMTPIKNEPKYKQEYSGKDYALDLNSTPFKPCEVYVMP